MEEKKAVEEERKIDKEMAEPDIEAVKRLTRAFDVIKNELRHNIVGMDRVIEELLIAIFSRGHCILEGVPGLAKTLLVSSLSQCLSSSFNRIQFTPDLMPADITGTEVIHEDKATGERVMKFLKGPVFANVILADEINRTPPKTQAALLEAMQERQVTTGGVKRKLDEPFFVLATQNPIEQEGTYPLPEAQLDRFMFKIFVDYPSREEEKGIMELVTAPQDLALNEVLASEEILNLQDIVRRVPVADHVVEYAMNVARATRITKPEALDFCKEWLSWGAGPRAPIYMIIGAKARAILYGRYYVSTEDIKKVAHPVLRHRIITNFNAEAEGISTDDIVNKLLETIPAKESEVTSDERLPKVFK